MTEKWMAIAMAALLLTACQTTGEEPITSPEVEVVQQEIIEVEQEEFKEKPLPEIQEEPILPEVSEAESAPEETIIQKEIPMEQEAKIVPISQAPINEGTVFEGCQVTVRDQKTPATYSGGKDWPISSWYFFSEEDEILGSISAAALSRITEGYGSPERDWSPWLAEAFNEYRGLDVAAPKKKPKPSVEAVERDLDSDEAVRELIRLTNRERRSQGLDELEVREELMELAQIRAKEVSEKYSHERPDGSRVVDLGYGENIGAKRSAQGQISSWMNSSGHRNNILMDWYQAIGIGCFRADNGKTYWVQIFAP